MRSPLNLCGILFYLNDPIVTGSLFGVSHKTPSSLRDAGGGGSSQLAAFRPLGSNPLSIPSPRQVVGRGPCSHLGV